VGDFTPFSVLRNSRMVGVDRVGLVGKVTPAMLRKLFATDDSTTLLVQRVALGAVLFPHGAQKLLGWFGGYGWDGTMGFLTAGAGLPTPIAALVILIEFFGALALIAGVGTRLAALGATAVMVGAIATVHGKVGFFMNWSGTAGGEGFEYHLLALALAVPLVIKGAGAYSVDRLLARRLGSGAGVAEQHAGVVA
jgi:putative oxidoreductase